MSLEKIENIYTDFRKALERLKEALDEDLSKGNIIVDGAIQRFEFTFELAWKLAKAMLNYNGLEADSPRPVIKEAFKANIIKDGQSWIDMLEDRNKTSHIYDEAQAVGIYNKIKENHFELFKIFESEVTKFIKNNT